MTKQVTPEQLDIWLNDPVTQAYLDAMQYCHDQSREQLASSTAVDPSNSSTTLYNQGYLAGTRNALAEALNPQKFLGHYERAEVADAA
jgi:hypothetical protein